MGMFLNMEMGGVRIEDEAATTTSVSTTDAITEDESTVDARLP